jgi:hypothetical protein
MSDDETKQLLRELNQQISEVNKCFQILGKAIADQQILTLRVMAAQAANFAIIRSRLAGSEQDNFLMSELVKPAFQDALKEFCGQLQAYDKSRDVMAFVNSLIESPPKEHN